MSYEGRQETVTLKANADLSAHIHKFVKFSSGKVVLATASGEDVIGVLNDKPAAADRECSVAISGIVKVLAGEAIAVGDFVATAADGYAKKVTSAALGRGHVDTSDTGGATDAVLGAHVMGRCLVASTADGDVITIHLFGGPRVVPTTSV